LVGVAILFVRGGPDCKSQISNFRFESVVWRVANVAGLIVAAGAVMSPWAIRNHRIFGTAILTTTHGGYTLYLGNNEQFYDYLAKGDSELPWQASSLQPLVLSKDTVLTEEILNKLKKLSTIGKKFEEQKRQRGYTDHPELRNDFIAYEFAELAMHEQPRMAALACAYRVGQLWSPLPHKLTADESTGRQLLRYATCAWYCGVYVLVAVGVWRLRRKLLAPPWIWGVLLCFAFTAVHTFYWTNLRMRAPLMPFVAIIAAAGVARMTERRRDRGTESEAD
jgi:hypothetical protein